MENLYEHTLIHSNFSVFRNSYFDCLRGLYELRHIFFREFESHLPRKKTFHMYRFSFIFSETFEHHDFFCDLRETLHLCTEVFECLRAGSDDTIMESLQIEAHRCQRCTNLMGKIREKIRSYLFLEHE